MESVVTESRILNTVINDEQGDLIIHGRDSISGKGRIFLFVTVFRPALGPAQLPIQCLLRITSPGVKRPVSEDNLPRGYEYMELYLHATFMFLRHCIQARE
jgi:hypothetical protein